MINLKLRMSTRKIEGLFILLQDSPAFFEDTSI